ncbi:hypothetical protein [sulfur-oxidizing endosymbiont of Gigantopelta aegis]|uniref:hypothetical protein n=1 Tax=sulfur-oxidizing endosymbiont of Gigantopelta aegis TaxID=2794934 RepID=UPI0018DE2C82|nr:hypothetical protein [sulfur-oxidizing endosymbiont of Gigantopelta aegis]
MEGKKNIVFGFLFLVITASLGPYMIVEMLPDVEQAALNKQKVLSALQLAVSSDFENQETLDTMTAEEIAKANSVAIMSLNTNQNARLALDTMKGGPHAHGNLEAVLNILVGIVLGLLTLPALFKQILSWIFIVGTIMHAGMIFLAVFGFSWAGTLLATGIGPVLILLGLFLMGVATFIGYKKV